MSWGVILAAAFGAVAVALAFVVRAGRSCAFCPIAGRVVSSETDADAAWGLCAAVVAVFVLWLVLGWPWGVLVGLGAAVSTLVASAPRKRLAL